MEARGDSALSRKKGRAMEKYQIAPRAGIWYNRLRKRKREIQAWEDVPGMKIINFSVNRKRMAGTPRDRVVWLMQRMARHGYSHVPVMENDRLTGVFSASTPYITMPARTMSYRACG